MPRSSMAWFKFYPEAWLTDAERRSMSRAAQGWYMDVICLLWESSRPGYGVTFGGKPWNATYLAMVLDDDEKDAEKWLKECLENGVLKVEKRTGIFFQKRLAEEYEELAEKNSKERKRKSEHARNSRKTKDRVDAETDAESDAETSMESDAESGTELPRYTRARALSISSPSLSPSLSPTEVLGSAIREGYEMDDVFFASGGTEPEASPARAAKAHATALHQRAVAQPVNDPLQDDGLGDVLVEIALASPSGVACRWTQGVEGNTTAMGAILAAVETESHEQHLSQREAALWLLKQMRAVTERVMRERGWERYWNLRRFTAFLGSWEYRNPERFGGRSDDGNAGNNGEPQRRVAQVSRPVRGGNARSQQHDQPHGAGSGDAGGGLPTSADSAPAASGDGGSVPRRAGGADTAGSGAGVQQGSEGSAVRVSQSGPTRRIQLPD